MDRRGFLSVGGGAAAAFLCTIGGKTVAVRSTGDVARVDAAAAALPRPAAARRDPIDSTEFPTPAPQPGGQRREYWIGARTVRWDIAPSGRDEWMDRRVPRPRALRAFVYQPFSAGFARPLGKPRMPGPILHAEVGDVLVVHFSNLDTRLRQAVTMHSHGVRYNPEYDGAYLGDFTRAGGFVEPEEEFTYFWEATPDSVGVWPYHDHGPNHTLNTIRGLFGAVIVREKGAPAPDVEQVLFLHSFPPQVTGIPRMFHCVNGRSYAGNTPTIRAREGQRVAIHVIGMDQNFHTFHIHGHRWRNPSGTVVDCPTLGPTRRSPRASRRTTRGGGSTTATSIATRTPAWPVGTWWRNDPQEGQMQKAVIGALAIALVVPAAASAGNYPPPSNPGKTPKARGKGHTLTVCRRGCRYRKIQKAIDAANGRDTIRVKKGVYHEGVRILGSRYDGLKLIGDPKHPDRVVFDGKGVPKGPNQNAVLINAADDVVVRGFHARNYKANCFFATNLQDYVLDRLVAERCGVYGIYAFNSKGGRMTNSEAYYNPDSGFYVGQTPPQHGRVKRTLLKNLDSWGNVLGFSGTNMRYTTITKSRWYNNGTGIVPNVLDSEKYYPPTGNVISDNDVFWNNFNFYYGAPFKIPKLSAADIPYPIGVGILLFGSQNSVVEGNRISGNYLAGFAEVPAVQLSGNSDPKKNEASILRNNTVRGNDFGAGGDLNGYDMAYDGSGSGNCFEGNTSRSPNFPADNSTFVPCPGTNTVAAGVLAQLIAMSLGDSKDPASFEKSWIKHPHPPRKGLKPLERYRGVAAGVAAVAKQVRKTVRIGDNFFAPKSLRVPKNTKITWRWPSNPGDVHDVYLRSGPKGVKKFHSELAATGYSFGRTLTKPGLYKIICTIHAEMRMTVRVQR